MTIPLWGLPSTLSNIRVFALEEYLKGPLGQFPEYLSIVMEMMWSIFGKQCQALNLPTLKLLLGFINQKS